MILAVAKGFLFCFVLFFQEVMNCFWHSLFASRSIFHFLLLPVAPQEGAGSSTN